MKFTYRYVRIGVGGTTLGYFGGKFRIAQLHRTRMDYNDNGLLTMCCAELK